MSQVTSESQGSDVVAGVALGLFVGALLGLSLTPGTTSTVMTALVAVLAIFFGLTNAAETTQIRPATGRIAAFCIAALIATTAGIYVRTHDLLSPSGSGLPALATELKTIGYSDDEIHNMIKARYFGSSIEQKQPFPRENIRGQTGTEIKVPKQP
jgi:hypothetical protein